ncbi:MAG: tetratricopeptide repeat protein [Phormidesmis sp.]
MRLSPAGQRFYQEVRKADGRINLAAAALYIAQEEYWDMDPKRYLEKLDDMAADVRSRLPKRRYPLKVIETINHYLFQELNFSGNSLDYYNPDNSCLNCVIDRRLGIPITLSLVYLEVAHRIRFPMVGIGMPGHFLIRPVVDEMEIFVDPFNQGEVMFIADCKERFESIQNAHGSQVPWQDEFLSGVLPKPFLARILMNLKRVYLRLEAYDRAIATLDKLLLLSPRQPYEVRDRGLLHYELKNYDLAKQDLEGYLRSHPRAPDGKTIQQILKRIDLPKG